MMQLHHSRLLHYIILLYHVILGFFILYQYFIFKTAIIILFLFLFSIFYYLYFHLHLPKVKCSCVAFPFYLKFALFYYSHFHFFRESTWTEIAGLKLTASFFFPQNCYIVTFIQLHSINFSDFHLISVLISYLDFRTYRRAHVFEKLFLSSFFSGQVYCSQSWT